MSWPLHYVPNDEWSDGPRQVGDWTFADWVLEDSPDTLGANYHTLPNAPKKRLPIIIMLPDGSEWCPDRMVWSEAVGWHGDGWDVSGSLDPQHCTMTVSPSINVVNRYHGWVRDGRLTSDCEGRVLTFTDRIKRSR